MPCGVLGVIMAMFEPIISQFTISGKLLKAERFGSGLINDTFLCEFSEAGEPRKYILQRINTSVFSHPEQVMENVELVTRHIVGRLRAQGVSDPFSVTPALIHTLSSAAYHREASGAYWRMFHFIESGDVFDKIIDTGHAYEIGRGLGRFQSLVSDLAPEKLHDTLPGFHHTPKYLAEYDHALSENTKGRAMEIDSEAELVSRRRALAPLLPDLMTRGQLPLRVVHNDPKINNFMIHKTTREALCMLDLDTVKPGIVHFDFGDCVRSSANRAGEDAEELGSVSFDLPLFEAVTRGYLREARAFLTNKEIELLPASVKVITFELGVRFLADYLRGDTYFKIRYPTHNLHRARVQFKLLESIEAAEGRMISLVRDIAGRS
jgi:Ser/Thr protein kinase RdoA (MazF antagonist)